MTKIFYRVVDDFGVLGEYKDEMTAISACNKSYNMGNNPKMFEIIMKDYDWMKSYKELCHG